MDKVLFYISGLFVAIYCWSFKMGINLYTIYIKSMNRIYIIISKMN
jgi:hypothetical protein